MRTLRGLLVSGLLVSAPACTESAAGPVAGEEYLSMESDQVIIGLEHSMTTNGLRRAHLVGDTAYVEGDTMEVVQPRMEFYGENGEQTGDLVAERGFLNNRSQQMTVRGAVVLNTVQGRRTIQTEELHFDPQGNRMWSDVRTTSREGGSVITGTGFTATLSGGTITNVRVRNPSGSGLKIEL